MLAFPLHVKNSYWKCRTLTASPLNTSTCLSLKKVFDWQWIMLVPRGGLLMGDESGHRCRGCCGCQSDKSLCFPRSLDTVTGHCVLSATAIAPRRRFRIGSVVDRCPSTRHSKSRGGITARGSAGMATARRPIDPETAVVQTDRRTARLQTTLGGGHVGHHVLVEVGSSLN